ncbi:AAA family ATPase [Actinomycetes bacterium NPDC127524]
MEIKELHVYGYGRLENVRFENLEQLQIFYGENETGKSTIMSFIHSILFGFPTRVQNELRYEPKLHAKYGGMLTLQTKEYGAVRIERVKGKAAGDVSLIFEDGQSGGESELRDVLQGIDKNFFLSVFSFNLDGLQGLHTLTEGTIGKYLLSAGLIGNDKLMEAEARLQGELDARFKPSGQKPFMNVRLEKLRLLQTQLKKADADQSEYEQLLLRQKDGTLELAAVQSEIKAEENQLMQIGEFLRLKPLAKEKRLYETRLSELGNSPFPADGLKLLDQFNGRLMPLKAHISSLLEKTGENQKKAAQMEVHPFLSSNRAHIEFDIQSASLLEKLIIDQNKMQQLLERKEGEVQRMKRAVSLPLQEAEILQLDTSIFAKERIKSLEKERQRLRNQKEHLDSSYKEEKERLEAAEDRIRVLKERAMPPEKRRELENEHRNMNQDYLEGQKTVLDEQIAELQNKYQEEEEAVNSKKSRTRLVSLFSFILLISLALYCFFRDSLFPAISFVLIGVLISTFPLIFKSANKLSALTAQLKEVKRKREEFERKSKGTESEARHLTRLLDQERELQTLLEGEKYSYREREKSFDEIINEYEKWERDWKLISEKLGRFVSQWNIPQQIDSISLDEALNSIEQLKDTIEEKDAIHRQLTDMTNEIEARKKKLLEYADACGLNSANWQDAIIELKHALNDHNERTGLIRQLQTEHSKINDELDLLYAKQHYLEQEIRKLLQFALAESEEEFRQKASIAQEISELRKKHEWICIQLQQSNMSSEMLEEYMEKGISVYSQEALEAKRKTDLKKQSLLLETLSDIKHSIRVLEEGGTYEQMLHSFHEEKEAFREEARVWAKYALAKRMLDGTIESFKRERLPKVLLTAGGFLEVLTEGSYVKLIMNEKGDNLLLRRYDGVLFKAEEVSRGTAEGVYISLRLALAEYIFREDPFPLIIDDSFVNLDAGRMRSMVKLLRKISAERQIIFFTCHDHLLNEFENIDIITLTKEKAVN